MKHPWAKAHVPVMNEVGCLVAGAEPVCILPLPVPVPQAVMQASSDLMLSHEPTDPHASLDPTLPDMASMVEYPAACPTLDAASQHAVSSVTHGSVAHLGLPDLRTWEPLVHVELWHVGRAAQHAISSVTHGSVAHLGLPALRTWELLVHVELWHVGRAAQHAISSVTHGSVAHLGLPDLRTWVLLVHVELWHVGRAAQHAISSVTHGSVAHLGLPALRTWELLVHVELWHVGLLVALHTIVYDTAAVPVMRYSPSSSVCVVQ